MAMSELIDRQALLEKENIIEDEDGFQTSVVLSADVRRAPAVSAVHAAGGCYCSECKHLKVFDEPDLYARCRLLRLLFEKYKDDTRKCFCSWGERRVEGD